MYDITVTSFFVELGVVVPIINRNSNLLSTDIMITFM